MMSEVVKRSPNAFDVLQWGFHIFKWPWESYWKDEKVLIQKSGAEFRLKISRCASAHFKVQFLRHIVSQDRITADLEKIKDISDSSIPHSDMELWRFLWGRPRILDASSISVEKLLHQYRQLPLFKSVLSSVIKWVWRIPTWRIASKNLNFSLLYLLPPVHSWKTLCHTQVVTFCRKSTMNTFCIQFSLCVQLWIAQSEAIQFAKRRCWRYCSYQRGFATTCLQYGSWH